jgi:hypothetical protein
LQNRLIDLSVSYLIYEAIQKIFLLGLFFYICLPGNIFSQVSFPDCNSNYFRNTFINPGENHINDFVVLPVEISLQLVMHKAIPVLLSMIIPETFLFSKKIPVQVINNLSLGKIRWASSSPYSL